jgi:MOSC domain-containing protein YiiM
VQEGRVQAGQPLTLIERPFAEWTIARVNDVTYGLDGTTSEDGQELVR